MRLISNASIEAAAGYLRWPSALTVTSIFPGILPSVALSHCFGTGMGGDGGTVKLQKVSP